MERKEVTLYGMTVDDSRSVPIKAIQNSDGSYSVAVAGGGDNGRLIIGPEPVSFTNRSGTIAIASLAQEVMPANLNRKYLIVQNVSANTLWINFNTDANEDQPSMQLLANGGSFVMEASAIVTDSVSIIGGTVGQSYTAKEG